jgi:alpha-glucosidase (family GH31 glycosyl hydrolase)
MNRAFVVFFFGIALARPAAAQSAHSTKGVFVVGPARFTVLAPECVRIEYSTNSVFVDDPSLFAMERDARFLGYQVEQSTGRLVLDTGRVRLTYVPDGRPLSAANLKAEIRVGTQTVTWVPEQADTANLGGTRNLDEAKGPLPMQQGLLSRGGWHVVDDSKRPLLKDGWIADRPSGSGTDWFLFGYGHDYKAALKALTTVGGPVPLPRRYALGSWYSRWWPHSSTDYRRIVQEYHEHGFPLDVLVMDMDWHKPDDWTGYSWNRKLFPDAEEYLKWVHAQGLFATLNEHPQGGVQPFEDRYADFMRAMGRDPAKKEILPFDAGDRRYMETFIKYMHAPLDRAGVDFWWLDYWSDDPKFPRNRLGWLDEYYFRRSELDGRRGMSFSRWDSGERPPTPYMEWGIHRDPILFSGDTFILWSTLAFEIPFTANSGNVGAFFWSHDIGGYQGERNGELLARWTQFGAFSAVLRLHSYKDVQLDKRPWSYPTDIEDSMRVAFRLRSTLFPYTYSSAWQSHSESLPLLRPLSLEYPEAEDAYRNPQEYLYGDAFLVAPIVSPGRGRYMTGRQTVWFPDGDWYDWFTGERVHGPALRVVEKDIDAFPLYAKGGVPLAMQPFTERMGTAPLRTLILRAYPGAEGETGRATLYEDDGVSRDYLSGGRALTAVSYLKQGNRVTMRVEPTQGRFHGQLQERGYTIELPGEVAVRAQLDQDPIPVDVSTAEKVSRVTVPARDIRRGFTVVAWLVQ